MFDRLFRFYETTDATGARLTLRAKFDNWRFDRDMVAIMVALGRLSDRRLEMIGMHRSTLFDSVANLMVEAERQREVGREVVALLENATDAHGGDSSDAVSDNQTSVSKAA